MFKKSNTRQSTKDIKRRADKYRRMLRQEAIIGGKVFGAVEPGRRREFLCLDERTWLWHEEWREPGGKLHSVTTRYDIRPTSIAKHQNGREQDVSAEEALNLLQAAKIYQKRIREKLYLNN